MTFKRRGIDIDTRCPVCLSLDEDGGHCFLKCKFVCKCWQALEMEQTRLELMKLCSSREVVQYVLAMEEAHQQRCVVLLWAWWEARNKVNAGEKMPSTTEIIRRIQLVLIDLQEYLTNGVPTTCKGTKLWASPPPEIIKVNIDGAFWEQEKHEAWGFTA
jgi:hypothetical protein